MGTPYGPLQYSTRDSSTTCVYPCTVHVYGLRLLLHSSVNLNAGSHPSLHTDLVGEPQLAGLEL